MPHPLVRIYEIIAFLESLWTPVWGYLNTNFSAALFGAFAGAYGAHILAKRQRQDENLRAEIQATNAAIMVSFDIANAYLGFKRQFIVKLKKDFDKGKASFTEAENRINSNKNEKTSSAIWKATVLNGVSLQMPSSPIVEIVFDLNTLSPFYSPTDLLQELVFKRIRLNGRPLHLATTLVRTIESLEATIEERAKFIEHFFQTSATTDTIAKAYWYFGLPDKNGTTNSRFSDTVRALYDFTDDCIKFAMLLSDDLYDHGIQVKSRSKSLADIPINKLQFTQAIDLGLLPDPEKYKDWDTKLFGGK